MRCAGPWERKHLEPGGSCGGFPTVDLDSAVEGEPNLSYLRRSRRGRRRRRQPSETAQRPSRPSRLSRRGRVIGPAEEPPRAGQDVAPAGTGAYRRGRKAPGDVRCDPSPSLRPSAPHELVSTSRARIGTLGSERDPPSATRVARPVFCAWYFPGCDLPAPHPERCDHEGTEGWRAERPWGHRDFWVGAGGIVSSRGYGHELEVTP